VPCHVRKVGESTGRGVERRVNGLVEARHSKRRQAPAGGGGQAPPCHVCPVGLSSHPWQACHVPE